MKDWRTTVTAFVTALAAILSGLGVVFPESWQGIIIAIGVALLGLFAKDKGS